MATKKKDKVDQTPSDPYADLPDTSVSNADNDPYATLPDTAGGGQSNAVNSAVGSPENMFDWQDKADAKIADFMRRRTKEDIDKQTTDAPIQTPQWMHEADSTFQNVTRRAGGGLASMAVHPVKALIGTYELGKELGKYAIYDGYDNKGVYHEMPDDGPIAQRVKEFHEEYARSPREAIENISGDLLGMYVGGKILDVAGKPLKPAAEAVKKYATEKAPRGLMSRLIRPMAADVKFGKDPQAALIDEGISGNSLDSIGDKVSEKMGEVGRELDQQASLPQNATKIVDISSSLKPIDDAMVGASSSGDIALWQRLKDLKDQLTYNWKPFRAKNGEWTLRKTTPRNLKMNPKEALAFKRMVGDKVRWTQDPLQGPINQAAWSVYGALKDAVNQYVPGLKRLNERYSNLVGAAKAIQRRIPIEDRNAQWSLSDIALGATGHLPMAIARKVVDLPGVTTRLAQGLSKAKNLHAPPIVPAAAVGGILSTTPKPASAPPATGPQSSVSTPKELREKAKQLNPSAQGQTAYAHTAVNPASGHKIGSKDGLTWYDLQTGAKVA